MNVNNLTDKPAAVSPSTRVLDRAAVPAQGVGAPDAAAVASVEVRLSAVTQTMTNNVARSGTDVFNVDKVEAMRAAIQNGSFSVSAEAIADKLIANAREMMSVVSAAPSGGNSSNALR